MTRMKYSEADVVQIEKEAYPPPPPPEKKQKVKKDKGTFHPGAKKQDASDAAKVGENVKDAIAKLTVENKPPEEEELEPINAS